MDQFIRLHEGVLDDKGIAGVMDYIGKLSQCCVTCHGHSVKREVEPESIRQVSGLKSL